MPDLFGGGSSAPPQVGTQTITSSPNPWGPQQPYLTFGMGQAQNIYNQFPQKYYPGETQAPVNPMQTSALDAIGGRASAGSPVNGAASQNVLDTLNGNFLSAGNPYFSQMMQTVGQSIRPQIDSQFESAGRYGSGASANAYASALANAATNAAYNNYSTERGNQVKDTYLAPQIANQDYTDLNNLYNAGSQARDLQQQYVNEDINRFSYNQQAPYLTLQQYLQGIGAPLVGNTTTQPIYGQTAGQQAQGAMGSALGGALLANSLFGAGTASTAGGAGAGLLLGLL